MSDETTAKPVFLNAAARRRCVKLQWPLEYEGKIFDEVILRRLSSEEVAEWIASDGKNGLPIYVDADGAPIPRAIIDALDDDDMFEVDKVVRDFFPLRFLGSQDDASAPGAGENIAPT